MTRSNLGGDQKKSMTGIHVRLTGLIQNLGFHVEDEHPFPPYSVDCYVPEAHVAFEADGPGHLKKRDAARDAELELIYGVLVRRFSQKDLENTTQVEDEIIEFIDRHADTAETRRRLCQ